MPAADPARVRDQAVARLAAGDRAGAADAFMRYIALPICDPLLSAAAKDIAAERIKDAHVKVRAYLKQHPNDPVALRMLAQVGSRLESSVQAEVVLRQTLKLVPAYHRAHYELAVSLFFQGRSEEALAELAILLKRRPADTLCRRLKAATLATLGEFGQALVIYQQLRDELPDNPRPWLECGNMLRTLRRTDEALAAFRRATELAPEFGEAWWNIANMKTGALEHADIARLRDAIRSPKARPSDVYHLRFALARALEESGAFADSFAEYQRANAARLSALPELSTETAGDAARRTAALFTPAFITARDGAGNTASDPIFILGMPRSGSTLLEQILSAHPLIEGTQELADIPVMARRIRRSRGGAMPDAYPEAIADLTSDELHALGTEYLERAGKKRKTDRPYFLDKQPVNWYHVGLIHLILPNARILDMRRDPVECCLSMFRQHFGRGAAFTYSPELLAAEYRAYEAMMAHFDEVLPGRIRRVELSSLQADFETQLRGILDYLGLPFAPECLAFHESKRPVFTPSSEQVRKPINRDAGGLFRNFEPYIGELRDALDRAAEA